MIIKICYTNLNKYKGFIMDMSTLAIGLAIIAAFVVGLLLDVDTFAGGIFSILKGSKDKDN